MDAIECIMTRRSSGRLVEPAPSAGDLDALLRAAMAGPDHGRLRPWRFVVVRGPGLERLGEVFAKAHAAREPTVPAAELERTRGKPLRAPLIVVVVSSPKPSPKTSAWPRMRWATANTGQLACFAEDDDRVSDRHGRLGPAAMVGTFELVAAHLAFHRTRVGTQPPLGDPLSNDLGDRPPDRPGDLVRGKTPRGWPGDDARSAACPQTTAGRGPSPRPGRPGASAGGSRSGPAGAPRPPAPHPQDAWSAAPPARRAGGS